MSPYYHTMPVDKTTIKTKLRVHPDLFDNPAAFIRKHDLPLRTVKSTRGKSANGPTRNLTLDVLTYKGIKVKLAKAAGMPLVNATIDFNPGVCLYGHNGSIISLSEFLDALGLLVTHLKPMLKDPDDWVDLIPGLRSEGRAYWSYLEVQLQSLDPDGKLLSGFRHARHPSITTPTRHWPTSIQIGGNRSKLQLSIYQKGSEMVAHNKLPESKLADYRDVLRLEVRMKEDKLVRYFGNGHNVEVIDGKERLIWFYPQYLVKGHRDSFSELEGVYSSTGTSEGLSKNTQLAPMGQLLAQVALDPRTANTLPELLACLKFYTGASCDTKASKKKLSNTISVIKKAGLAELSRHSSISRDDVFSDTAYRAQHGIASEEPEDKIFHEVVDTHAHQLIYAAYSPPGQPFQPVTQLPGYFRL